MVLCPNAWVEFRRPAFSRFLLLSGFGVGLDKVIEPFPLEFKGSSFGRLEVADDSAIHQLPEAGDRVAEIFGSLVDSHEHSVRLMHETGKPSVAVSGLQSKAALLFGVG